MPYAGEVSSQVALNHHIDVLLEDPTHYQMPGHIANMPAGASYDRLQIGAILAYPGCRSGNTLRFQPSMMMMQLNILSTHFNEHRPRAIPGGGDESLWSVGEEAPEDADYAPPVTMSSADWSRDIFERVAWSHGFSIAKGDGRYKGDPKSLLEWMYRGFQRIHAPMPAPAANAGDGAGVAAQPPPPINRIIVQTGGTTPPFYMKSEKGVFEPFEQADGNPSILGNVRFASNFTDLLSKVQNGALTSLWDSKNRFYCVPFACHLTTSQHTELLNLITAQKTLVPYDDAYRMAYPDHSIHDWMDSRYQAAKATPAWVNLESTANDAADNIALYPNGTMTAQKFAVCHQFLNQALRAMVGVYEGGHPVKGKGQTRAFNELYVSTPEDHILLKGYESVFLANYDRIPFESGVNSFAVFGFYEAHLRTLIAQDLKPNDVVITAFPTQYLEITGYMQNYGDIGDRRDPGVFFILFANKLAASSAFTKPERGPYWKFVETLIEASRNPDRSTLLRSPELKMGHGIEHFIREGNVLYSNDVGNNQIQPLQQTLFSLPLHPQDQKIPENPDPDVLYGRSFERKRKNFSRSRQSANVADADADIGDQFPLLTHQTLLTGQFELPPECDNADIRHLDAAMCHIDESNPEAYNAVCDMLEAHVSKDLRDRRASQGDTTSGKGKGTAPMHLRGSMYRDPKKTLELIRKNFPDSYRQGMRARHNKGNQSDDSGSHKPDYIRRLNPIHSDGRRQQSSGISNDRHSRGQRVSDTSSTRSHGSAGTVGMRKRKTPVKLSDLKRYADGLIEMSQRASKLDSELAKRMKSMAEALEHASSQRQVTNRAYGTIVLLSDSQVNEYEEAQQLHDEHYQVFYTGDTSQSDNDNDDVQSLAESQLSENSGEDSHNTGPDPDAIVDLNEGFATIAANFH